mgnify:CR=1 FL=1
MLKTTLLMGFLTALMLLIGDYVGGTSGMTFMLAFSLLSNVLMYWFSDKMVIAQYRAKPVDAQSAPMLYGIVARLAERAGLPMPKVYVVDTALPNAFATGRNPEHAAVCVTTGLMETLEPREIAGVLGHEMSHVKHNDILISTIAAGMAGVISLLARFAYWFGGSRDDDRRNPLGAILILVLTPLAAAIIQLAISRTRTPWRTPWKRLTATPICVPCPGLRKLQPICLLSRLLVPGMPRPCSAPIRPRSKESSGCGQKRKK